MTDRTLPIEAQLDADEAFSGKLWAYVPVTTEHGCALGVAVANERGYSPISAFYFHVKTYTEAEAEADRLNTRRKMSEDAAWQVIASTMAAQNAATG